MEGVILEKYFSTHSERIKILRSRNMTILNGSEEKELLKKYNYYNLVNAYKDPFLYQGSSSVEKYKTGTRLSELEALLVFDSNLRLIFLKEILRVEEIIKNQIVQSFYNYHLNDNPDNSDVEKSILHRDSEYLRRKYYDLTTSYSVHNIDSYGIVSTTVHRTQPNGKSSKLDRLSVYDDYISTVYRTLGQQRKNKNDSIKSYLEQHGYMPMWILMNVLTFGNVSHLFTLQKKDVQLHMIKTLGINNFSCISDDLHIINTSRILQVLSLFRNTCAHNERFYLSKIRVPIDDYFMNFGHKLPYAVNPAHRRRLNASQKNKRLNARRGIYSLIFSLSLFMDKQQLSNLIKEIRFEFKILEGKLSTIKIDEIERFMGMNFNWYDLIKSK
jgi:abortive infection bacteriophage resistance protein